MLARNKAVKFASGALVFPGGAVDPADTTDAARACHVGAEAWDNAELGMRASAIREVFEETGILMAYDAASGIPIDAARAEAIASRHREPLLAESITMAEIAEAEAITFATDALTFYAHWITPKARPVRFDTKFYLARMPAGQDGVHDGSEAVDSEWIHAGNAEAEMIDRGFSAMFPTMLNLEMLAESASVDDAIQVAKNRDIVVVIPAVKVNDSGEKMVVIPENAGYTTTSYPFEKKWIKS